MPFWFENTNIQLLKQLSQFAQAFGSSKGFFDKLYSDKKAMPFVPYFFLKYKNRNAGMASIRTMDIAIKAIEYDSAAGDAPLAVNC